MRYAYGEILDEHVTPLGGGWIEKSKAVYYGLELDSGFLEKACPDSYRD